MKNKFMRMGIPILVLLLICACKKEQKQANFLEDARAWYLKKAEKLSYTLKSSKNEVLPVNPEIQWNQGKTFRLDGVELLTVPLALKFADGRVPSGSFALLISKSNEIFRQVTVYNREKGFFSNLSKEQVQSTYFQSNETLTPNKSVKSATNGKTMNVGDPGSGANCIDWYLVETAYSDGVTVFQSETYVGTTCSEGIESLGGGGEGRSDTDENKLDTAMKRKFFQNEKAMCALAKLMEGNFFKNTLNNFIGENKPIDLTFDLDFIEQESGFRTDANTRVDPANWEAKDIIITLAENRINEMSSLEVGVALLHEGIHAEIYRKLLSIHGPSKLNNMNFPSMFNLYKEYKISQGFSHEYMANYYVEIMATALKKFDNAKFGDEYYKAIAYTGLKQTDYYTGLSEEKKKDIVNKTTQLLANRSKQNCDDL